MWRLPVLLLEQPAARSALGPEIPLTSYIGDRRHLALRTFSPLAQQPSCLSFSSSTNEQSLFSRVHPFAALDLLPSTRLIYLSFPRTLALSIRGSHTSLGASYRILLLPLKPRKAMSQRPTARSRSSFLSQPPASRPRPGRHGPTKARLPHAQNEVKDEPSQQRDAEPVLQQDAAPHSAFKSGPSSSRSQSPSEPLPESASRLPPAQALTPSSNSRNRVPTRSEQSEASMSMSISDGPSPPRTTAPPDWRFGQRRASVQPLSPTHILRSVACSDPFWQAGEDPSPPRKRADSIGGVPVDGRRPSVVPDALAQENPWQADSLCGSGDSETWVPSPPVFEQGQPLSTQVLQSDPERSSNDSTTAPITPELFPIPSL